MKPGIKTTEFWITVLSTLLGFAVSGGFIGTDFPREELVATAANAVIVMAYIVGRTRVKTAAAKGS